MALAVVVLTQAGPDHQAHHAGYHRPHQHLPLPPPVPVHHAPVYKAEPHPYSYKYGVHDEYSGANFNADETADGHGNVEGSYRYIIYGSIRLKLTSKTASVLLPDGRVQHVKYHADHHSGYVADVTYEGTAHHPHH